WYLIDRGTMAVLIDGFEVNELTRGDSFGELALLRERPRAATVRALTEVGLLALERDAFLTAIAGGEVEVRGALGSQERTADADPAELLSRTALLSGLSRREIADLAATATRRAVNAGGAIVAEGDSDDSYYVLLSGRARVSVAGEERTELLAGDGFGEIAVLHRVARTATVTAAEDCLLLAVPGEALRTVLATRGGLLGELVGPPETVPEVKTVEDKTSEPAGRRSDEHARPIEIEEEGRV
ncbi:MAG TPA: cyclic nucleotide-binding domain-containing protein, partial [Solirubrobacteraceae bacterium]